MEKEQAQSMEKEAKLAEEIGAPQLALTNPKGSIAESEKEAEEGSKQSEASRVEPLHIEEGNPQPESSNKGDDSKIEQYSRHSDVIEPSAEQPN